MRRAGGFSHFPFSLFHFPVPFMRFLVLRPIFYLLYLLYFLCLLSRRSSLATSSSLSYTRRIQFTQGFVHDHSRSFCSGCQSRPQRARRRNRRQAQEIPLAFGRQLLPAAAGRRPRRNAVPLGPRLQQVSRLLRRKSHRRISLLRSSAFAFLSLGSLNRLGRTSRQFWRQRKAAVACARKLTRRDRKSTRLNSSHPSISYAVFCLKKKKDHLS